MADQLKSIVAQGEIFYVPTYLSKEKSDSLFDLLNDDTKFAHCRIYYMDNKTGEFTVQSSQRPSYWFGDYPQAAQYTNHYVTHPITGEKVKMPTDFVKRFDFPPEILELKTQIERQFDVKFNSCLVGMYNAPTNKIGFHSDASSSMGLDPHIASVSFGKSRRFAIKKQSAYRTAEEVGKPIEKIVMDLNHGDLVVMRKNANLKYHHAVLADPDCNESNIRINLTFRNYEYDAEEINQSA